MESVHSEIASKYRIEGFSDENTPDWLLSEILLRLPVKSLFRFKCVSRRWHSLISDPYFACSYKYSLPWTFLFHLTDHSGRMNPDGGGLHAAFKFCHPDHYKLPSFILELLEGRQGATGSLRVLACSNSLLLCSSTQHRKELYYVCNPLTMQWVGLPRRPQLHKWVNIGFVVEPEDGSFHVVRIAEFSCSTNVLDLEIFSSSSGKWITRKLPCVSPVMLSIRHRNAVSYRGILHWREYNNRIIAYNPRDNTDQCRLLGMPTGRDRDGQGVLGVSQDSLRYFEVHKQSQKYGFSVWVLRNYEFGEWCLEYRVSVAEIGSADPLINEALHSTRCFLNPLAFHPLIPDVVFLVCYDSVVLFNFRTRRFHVDLGLADLFVIHNDASRLIGFYLNDYNDKLKAMQFQSPPGHKWRRLILQDIKGKDSSLSYRAP
ncbi:hypothetical protein Nepgr_008927 [Nepenthes gracilis]|uniref:F-box domain-containing protein n=1 Tax=Nepenthes gracilis TaxID=150966 RepID=A0AAD3S9U8_NEPGR|nr:hypothetical protein Nepgr_008927 [Nepenthes gracilis]